MCGQASQAGIKCGTHTYNKKYEVYIYIYILGFILIVLWSVCGQASQAGIKCMLR